MKTKTEPKFLLEAREADKLLGGWDIMHWEVRGRKTYIYEDDGALHIEKNGTHVVFGIGQDRPLREQNERMTMVLMALRLFNHPDVAKNCLASQDEIKDEESDDDECPCCGRGND